MAITHAHPSPALNRAVHYGALAVLIVLAASVPLQVLLALSGARGGLFTLSALATLLLALPILLLITATPAVSISEDGLTVHPVIWRARFIPWQAVRELKDYPLLPPPDTEVGRRVLVGRRKYRPAQGVMLVIPGLPAQYRVTGFFAGEGLTSVIALTSRTHTDYEQLVNRVRVYVGSRH